MANLRALALKAESATARAARVLDPLGKVPAHHRAALLRGAVAVLLLAAGVVIGKQLAWIAITAAVTVIVVVGLAGFFASRGTRPERDKSEPSQTRPATYDDLRNMRVPVPAVDPELEKAAKKSRDQMITELAERQVAAEDAKAKEADERRKLKVALEAQLKHGRYLLKHAPRNTYGAHLPGATRAEDVTEWVTRVDIILKGHPRLRERFHYEPPVPLALTALAPTLQALGLQSSRLTQYVSQLESIVEGLN